MHSMFPQYLVSQQYYSSCKLANGDSPAHRNSSGSGNYEGNGAISEVMGLALHTGLAPAFLYCTTTQYLAVLVLVHLSSPCIEGPILDWRQLSCITQYLAVLVLVILSTTCIEGPAYWILHIGLAPAFLCCRITQYLVLLLSTICILDSRALHTGFDLSCVVQLLNTLNCTLDQTLLSSPILYTSFSTTAPLLVLPLTLLLDLKSAFLKNYYSLLTTKPLLSASLSNIIHKY